MVGEGVDPGTGAVVGEVVGLGATAAIGAVAGALVPTTTGVAGAFGASAFLGAAALPPAEAPGRTVLVGTWPATGTAAAVAAGTGATGGAITVRTTCTTQTPFSSVAVPAQPGAVAGASATGALALNAVGTGDPAEDETAP